MTPKISVIVPCYKQAQFLDAALQSVLVQTYTNWECIIINDGSPDDTEKIARNWTTKDARFKYGYQPNGGLSSARNAGLKMATGHFIQFLDADDYLAPQKLEASINRINLDHGTNTVITNFRMFDTNPAQSSEPYCKLSQQLFTLDKILYHWESSFTIPIHCGLFAASFFEKFRFPEELRAKEDWVMWICLYKTNCKTGFIDQPLALYRKNPNSITQSKDMLPDVIKAYQYLKTPLSESQYQGLTISMLSRYYTSAVYFKTKRNEIKASNTYIVGNLIKRGLSKLGILKPFKKVLEWIYTKK
ncbi:glycosyltransferase family 2 protein [Flavobacterium crassostreae]|uniref:Glycosyltransferase 2-like domain-containing protein n=1 Tax=Flavobacterium crassostreae TaxID=1763534 RepID=A0A1B9E3N4_9FLAO|nr:glycosyltransferase family 2 protein [Flavobacterium crassostreae]OCB76552.1 hypothetical protein LPBF_06360 [Flavobacterium crassostreae]